MLTSVRHQFKLLKDNDWNGPIKINDPLIDVIVNTQYEPAACLYDVPRHIEDALGIKVGPFSVVAYRYSLEPL